MQRNTDIVLARYVILEGMWSGSRDLVNFYEIADNVSKQCVDNSTIKIDIWRLARRFA